jgi:hypothetical protein
MRDIYKDAKDVLIWLGPAADNSDDVINGLEKVGRRVYDYMVLLNWQYRFAISKWFSLDFPGVDLGPDDPTLEQLVSNITINDTPELERENHFEGGWSVSLGKTGSAIINGRTWKLGRYRRPSEKT